MTEAECTRQNTIHPVLRGARLGVLSTCHNDTPHASLMNLTFIAPEGPLVFSSDSDTRKVANLRQNPRAAILILPKAEELSTAYLVEGPVCFFSAAEHPDYAARHREAHPEMDAFIEGPQVQLMALHPERLQVTDRQDQSQVFEFGDTTTHSRTRDESAV